MQAAGFVYAHPSFPSLSAERSVPLPALLSFFPSPSFRPLLVTDLRLPRGLHRLLRENGTGHCRWRRAGRDRLRRHQREEKSRRYRHNGDAKADECSPSPKYSYSNASPFATALLWASRACPPSTTASIGCASPPSVGSGSFQEDIRLKFTAFGPDGQALYTVGRRARLLPAVLPASPPSPDIPTAAARRYLPGVRTQSFRLASADAGLWFTTTAGTVW